MVFYILEKKANDLYVIYDAENGGMCCCTPYTIKQLIDMGHQIPGVTLSPKFSAVILTKSGERAARNRVYDIDTTKRSASTISKGLKLSREEKKALREVVEKRNATRKENQKVAKQEAIAKEKQLKEEAKQKQLQAKKLEIVLKRREKSKCLAELKSIDEIAGEYRSTEWYTYELSASTPSALTAMKKLLTGFEYEEIKGASKLVQNGRTVKVTKRFDYPLEAFESGVQVVAASEVRLHYENSYDDTRLYASFSRYNHYKAYVGDSKGVDAYSYLGATADSGETLSDYEDYLRKKLGNLK